MLGEVEQALSGLVGPGGNGVRDLGLLATEVLAELLGRNSLVAEPEILLGENNAPSRINKSELDYFPSNSAMNLLESAMSFVPEYAGVGGLGGALGKLSGLLLSLRFGGSSGRFG